MSSPDFFIVAPDEAHIPPTPAELAVRYDLGGEVEFVRVGRGRHLIRPGAHRTMCGRLVSRERSTWTWPPRETTGNTACHVCDRIIHAAKNRAMGRARGEWL